MESGIQALPGTPANGRGRPLLPIRGVISLLDKDEQSVLSLIDEGSLLWAWDVSLQPERAKRKELRILPEAVEDFAAGRACRLEWADVVRLMAPEEGEALFGREIQRVLNVTETHLYSLVRQGSIKAATRWRRGPHGSARIHHYSFVEFLRARRFPVPEG